MRHGRHGRGNLDEFFVKINGVKHSLSRAVDHEGEGLESCVKKRRDKKAALKVLRKSLRRHGGTEAIVTDRLASCRAVLSFGRGWQGRDGALAVQPGGEQPAAFPTTGTGDAPLPANAKPADIRRVARLDPQSLLSGEHPRQRADIQGSSNHRSSRVVAPLRGLRKAGVGYFSRRFRLSDVARSTPLVMRRADDRAGHRSRSPPGGDPERMNEKRSA